MGDQNNNSGSGIRPTSNTTNTLTNVKKVYKSNVVHSSNAPFQRRGDRAIASLTCGKNGGDIVSQAAVFLLKVAALETVRRVSKARCPPVWRGIQALQMLCYPPLKWIRRWAPFKGLIQGVQMFSRPLLFLSIATSFSDHSDCEFEMLDGVRGSNLQLDSPSLNSPHDTRSTEEPAQSQESENWLIQLYKELQTQGFELPERINEDELHRFYTAANGDFSCFLQTIKKTIRWRETYRILSQKELQMWSNMVFWHGLDLENHPCLFIRLGLACANVPPHERPRFSQAVISQVEHGILNLVDEDNPRITVLVDCHGITPLRIPMQMIRSCSLLLQEHFPGRLGHLLVIRLPPVVRVIAQTFIQVLKPGTRRKLRVEGKMYHRVLTQYLQTIPSYLGGDCSCEMCGQMLNHSIERPRFRNNLNNTELMANISDGEELPSPRLNYEADISMDHNWDHTLRTAVLGLLMLWVFIALIAGLQDPESSPFKSP